VSPRPFVVATYIFLLLGSLLALQPDPAAAQSRWPPWQSYGEAESTSRLKARRNVTAARDLAMLKRQIAQLRAAGKYAEAVPLAQQAVALTEKKGAQSLALAEALDDLASLYEAQQKYADAAPLLKRSLAIREKAPGQPGVAGTRARLAAASGKMHPSAQPGVASRDDKAREDAKKAAELELARKRMEELYAQAQSQRMQQEQQQRNAGATREKAAPQGSARHEAMRERETIGRVGDAQPGSAREGGSGGAAAPMRIPRADVPAGGAAPPVASPAPPPAAAPAPSPTDEVEAMKKALNPSGGYAARSLRSAPRAAAPPPSASEPEMRPGAPAPDAAPAPAPPPPSAVGQGAPAPSIGGATPPDGSAASDPVGGGAPPPSPDWQVVPIYWGTDRAVQPNAQRLAFGSDRARKLQVGVADVTVPKVHQVPNVERPWVVKIPYFDVTLYAESEDPKKHFTVKDIKALTKEELLARVKERLGTSSLFKDQALVFVHGYNTSFDNALYRTAQIAYDLDFDGAPFLYSWPSGGAVASYTYDRESAQASEPYLRQFLEMVVKETGAKQVSIIAHSMGNQPLMDVLREMKDAAPEGVTISQVILAAPDVDADNFSNLAATIKGLAKNVTLYVASNDRALIVSRNFWGSYRAGDVPPQGPLVLPGIDTIDVTAASTDVFAINHSGYAANNRLLGDIGELLKTGLRPPEMRALKPGKVNASSGEFWRYVAPPQQGGGAP